MQQALQLEWGTNVFQGWMRQCLQLVCLLPLHIPTVVLCFSEHSKQKYCLHFFFSSFNNWSWIIICVDILCLNVCVKAKRGHLCCVASRTQYLASGPNGFKGCGQTQQGNKCGWTLNNFQISLEIQSEAFVKQGWESLCLCLLFKAICPFHVYIVRTQSFW